MGRQRFELVPDMSMDDAETTLLRSAFQILELETLDCRW